MNPTSPSETELRRELRWLRKGPGLSLARIRRCATLLDLPIVEASAAATGVGHARAALDLLTTAARNQPGRLGQALRYAWGVDFEGSAHNLGGRRTAVGADTQLKVGDAQLARLENKAIEEVITGFLEFKPRTRGFSPLPLTDVQSPAKTPEGHYPSSGYTVELLDVTYSVENRQPTEWHQYESLTATVDGLGGITPRYTFTGDPDSVHPYVWQGGKLGTVFPPTELGVYAYNIDFPRPLRRGQHHKIRYSRRITPSQPNPAPWVGFGPVVPTYDLIIRVAFAGELPIRVETRIGLGMTFPSPLETPEEVEIDANGVAEREFTDLVSGWGYGLEWTWGED